MVFGCMILLSSHRLPALEICQAFQPLTTIPAIGIGAAYGTAKAGIGISGVGTFRPDLIMKSLIPVVMAGIIAVYALVIAVLIANNMDPSKNYSLFTGFMHLGAGLSVGLSGMAAGYAIGIVGDMVRVTHKSRLWLPKENSGLKGALKDKIR